MRELCMKARPRQILVRTSTDNKRTAASVQIFYKFRQYANRKALSCCRDVSEEAIMKLLLAEDGVISDSHDLATLRKRLRKRIISATSSIHQKAGVR